MSMSSSSSSPRVYVSIRVGLDLQFTLAWSVTTSAAAAAAAAGHSATCNYYCTGFHPHHTAVQRAATEPVGSFDAGLRRRFVFITKLHSSPFTPVFASRRHKVIFLSRRFSVAHAGLLFFFLFFFIINLLQAGVCVCVYAYVFISPGTLTVFTYV